ncbi:hypothetical protein AX15_005128 [Amanita polypyramis BW_CC]|nr:hypothetical protein AX15_005128 [Amanita polypyramis BW_CC]
MDVLQRPVPQTPIGPVQLAVGVEESRAQRHERQQSRFRDRGGIFKPSNRNTLVDILMGRRPPSPRKSIRRSASCSPLKRDKTPSRTKSNADTANASKKGRTSRNDHVPPKKALRKSQAPAAPKGSDLEENREEHNAESETKLAPSDSALRKTRAAKKQRKRGPTQQNPNSTNDDMQERSAKPKPKRKTSKSKPTVRRKQTKSEKSKASLADKNELAAASSSAEVKSKSRLSAIPEEAEQHNQFDVDGERPKDANRDRRKRSGTEKCKAATAGASGGSRVASNGNEDVPILEKRGKVADSSMQAVRKGKMLTSKLAKEDSSLPDRSNTDELVKPRRRKIRGNRASDPAEMDETDAGITSEKTAEVKPPSWKGSEPPKPPTLSTHQKRQTPDPSDDDAEAEGLPRDAKRVRLQATGNKSGKQKHDMANAPVPTSQQVDVITQVAKASKGARYDGSIKQRHSATAGVQSRKRIRSPEDSNLSPSKRVKIKKADGKDPDSLPVQPGEVQILVVDHQEPPMRATAEP